MSQVDDQVGENPPGSTGVSACRRSSRWKRAFLGLSLCAVLAAPVTAANGLAYGIASYAAGNYGEAARVFLELANLGNPEAQTYIGRMFEKGQGVPQNFEVAADWYRCAAGQGTPAAAYSLGLMYDKGHGVPQDYVLAYTWLNRAVAGGSGPERPYWVNIRNAIASKLSLVQKLLAQEMALTGPEPGICLPMGYGPPREP